MSGSYEHIEILMEEDLAFLVFNRPDQLNAMNRKMMGEIVTGIEEINLNEQVKVAVIKGKGRAFMAGADIKEYGSQTPEEFRSFQENGKKLYESIEQSSKPWIAAVDGFALGGGCEIALCCDLILASNRSKMGLPEVHLSLIPGGGGTQRLTQKVGINRAKEMLFTGGQYTAMELYGWGIVNRVFEDENFDEEVQTFAKKLTRRSAQSITQLKRLAQLSLTNTPFQDRINDEGRTVEQLFLTEEAQQAIEAFISKTKS
ncbi:enoyl-CoA hydratase/isomerase family protein [Fulvivirga sp. M361]|uniref:enoyl-CoA hydratase/isomerase family protein n=1 Tax=Fulvivirga sp. M361 TaxID=2594266 RepID=UPI00117AB225|nr:enoyl-CoA hydratase/isomerase family protein [Fulvivirga sp. M361]TRX60052.1 enoyl-CoA hydratase/isomerase family protein [Fulvivirga sp. M361]